MKIGILTFHRAINYGALLQTYGLYKAIEHCGIIPEIVDFRSSAIEDGYRAWIWYGDTPWQKLKCIVVNLLLYCGRRRKSQAFQRFLEERLVLSEEITQLQQLQGKYEAFITGSDQVFNKKITGTDADTYFLYFPAAVGKKYSYAASFGKAALEEESTGWYQERLKDFCGYSVREKSGADIVFALTGKKAAVCLDPTLLLSQDQWRAICGSRSIKKPYILVYDILYNERLYEEAKKIKDQTGLKVICINTPLKKRLKHIDFIYIDDASPEDFLNLFAGARYVLTSSFHGTAFSIIFQKQFLSILPNANPRNDRILSLLGDLGLEGRVFQKKVTIEIDNYIDWEAVTKRLEVKKKESVAYLQRICQDIIEREEMRQ